MSKKYLRILNHFIIIFVALTLMGFQEKEVYPEKINLMLKDQTLRILNLRATNQELQKQVNQLKTENEVTRVELLRQKKVSVIIDYYEHYATYKQYKWLNRKYIYNVILLAEKHQGISKTFNFDTFDKVNFTIAWAVNESNLDPKGKYTNKKYPHTTDWGLMQINDRNLWMFNGKDKLNPEESIKVWYAWVDNKQANTKGVWGIWESFRSHGGKEIYYKLREIKI